MRSLIRANDARAKTNRSAGLSKAIKLQMTVNDNAPVAGANTIVRFNTITFNYGGFVVRPNATAGLYDGIVIAETGLHQITSRFFILGGAGISYLFLTVNNNAVLPDGTQAYNGGQAVVANTVFHVSDCLELKQGDVVSAFQNQATTPQVTNAGFDVLIVEKMGGQY